MKFDKHTGLLGLPKRLALLTVFFTALSCFVGSFTVHAVERDDDVAPRKMSVQRKDLDLTVGLDYYETLSYLPNSPSFRGDFKKIVKLAYSEETHQLRITPVEPGTATLTIHDARGQKIAEYLLVARKSNLQKIAREMTSLLQDIEGIQIKIVNNRVVVDGEVFVVKDISRIQQVVGQYGDLASSLVRLSPIAQKKIAEIIERQINDPEIHVSAANGSFILEGVAADENAKLAAEQVAKLYVPDIVTTPTKGVKPIARAPILNRITIRSAPPPEPEKIIQIVVHYVELKKDYTRGFRFQWTPTLKDDSGVAFKSGGDAAGGLVSTITGTISNLLPKLNYAKQHGHARILQSSSLIVEAGQPGKIRSVTRIPYQVIGPQGQPSTNFEEAGIITDITPNMVNPSSDSIKLKVDFKIKALLGISNSGPLISSNDINTVITVRSGQSAAIGGLVSNSSGTDYNKLPQSTGDNPLFSLFASKSFRRDQSQFVVFVTPVIKSSASQGAEQVKKKFRMKD